MGGAGVSGASAGGGCGEGMREGEPPPTEPSDASRATGGAPAAKRRKTCAQPDAAAPAPAAEKKADAPKAAHAPADAPKTKKKRVYVSCVHGKRKEVCAECGGNRLCEHGRQKGRCGACGGIGICEHGKRKELCAECGGNGLCEHGKQKGRCGACGGKGSARNRAPGRAPAVSEPRPLTVAEITAPMVQMAQELRLRAAQCEADLESGKLGSSFLDEAYLLALAEQYTALAKADKLDKSIRRITAEVTRYDQQQAAIEKERAAAGPCGCSARGMYHTCLWTTPARIVTMAERERENQEILATMAEREREI